MGDLIGQIVGGVFLVLSGGVGKTIADRVGDRFTGRADRKRSEVDKAWTRADREASHRRILAESLSTHRRIIIEAPCLGAADLPPYPTAPGQTGPIQIKENTDD